MLAVAAAVKATPAQEEKTHEREDHRVTWGWCAASRVAPAATDTAANGEFACAAFTRIQSGEPVKEPEFRAVRKQA